MVSDRWVRVSKHAPCPVCRRPDWCLYAGPDNDPEVVICARVESSRRCGDAGWLHRLRDGNRERDHRLVRRVALDYGPRPDFAGVEEGYRRYVDPSRLHRFSASLGLNGPTLCRFGVGWSEGHGAWSFPMRDAGGAIVGIRLRKPDGGKFAVKGSKEGLFIPEGAPPAGTLLIAEGVTDAAALCDMGYPFAVGRPSCSSGFRLVAAFVKRLQLTDAVIVSDNDEPGRRGAGNLASVLVAYVPSVRVIAPPPGVKDARDWLRGGGTRQQVDKAVSSATVRRLTIRRASAQKG